MKKRMTAIALLALMMMFLTACSADEIRDEVIDLAMSWAREHAIEIGSYAVFGTTGDDEVDAVLGARDVIENVNAADKLMEEGRKEGNLTKMEKAIEKRPGDYTYRVSYGAALLYQGDAAEAEAQFVVADEALGNYSSDHAQAYATQGIDELGALRHDFETKGFTSRAQCDTYYGRMAYFYEIRMATGEPFFEQQRDNYLAKRAACK